MKKTILGLFILIILGTMLGFTYNPNVIWGTYVTYKSSTQITVTTGSGRCNGTEWSITSEIDVTLSSFTGEDFIYIYIDDSASSYPTPTIIGATTEPSWSDTLHGFYNGDDRCIGAVWMDSANNVVEFQNNSNNEYITNSAIKTVLQNGNPNGAYQTVECTAYTPINSTAIFVNSYNKDTSDACYVSVAPYESNFAPLCNEGYNTWVYCRGWIPLQRGWSRDLKWLGYDNDDNSYLIQIRGYRIER